jgi:carboxyl-terminal processing protease
MWLVLVALLGVGLVRGVAAPAHASAGEDESLALSSSERVRLFEHVWRGVRDRYYDRSLHGVPWDEVRREYRPRVLEAPTLDDTYRLLDDMVARLGDSHTRVRTPLDRILREQSQSISIGIGLADLDDAVVVTRVPAGSPAATLDVTPGSRLVSLDDVQIDAWLAAAPERYPSSSVRASRLLAMRALLLGAPGSQMTAAIERTDGSEVRLAFTREAEERPTSVTSKRDGDILVIGWNRFRAPVRDRVQELLEEHADARAVVIDLRGNGGGSLREATELADLFVEGAVPFGRQTARNGRSRLRRTPTQAEPGFTGAVVVLVNGTSASASETLAAALQEAGRARVVGTQTCGCVLVTNGPTRLLGGGELSVSEFDYTTPGGRRLEGQGVIPDEEVRVTREDVLAGVDRALERAIAVAREDLAAPAGTAGVLAAP